MSIGSNKIVLNPECSHVRRKILRCSLVAQWVKALALPLLWDRFDPWSRNRHLLWSWLKIKETLFFFVFS